MRNTFYRGIAKEAYTKDIKKHFKTQRAPSNIPYFIDNIWEWLRPEHLPSRRYSVYASPKKELAEKYATSNDLICSVELIGDSKAVQLKNFEDAKLHTDIRLLQKVVMNYLGQDWLEDTIDIKSVAGRLFIPLLSKDEVDDILDTVKMRDLKELLIDNSTFWSDVFVVDEEYQLTNGELFFHSNDGYKLIKL